MLQIRVQRYVGVFYHDGTGVKRDYKTAVSWLRKAVQKDDPEAMYSLGQCYRYGRGVRKNARRGFRLQFEV